MGSFTSMFEILPLLLISPHQSSDNATKIHLCFFVPSCHSIPSRFLSIYQTHLSTNEITFHKDTPYNIMSVECSSVSCYPNCRRFLIYRCNMCSMLILSWLVMFVCHKCNICVPCIVDTCFMCFIVIVFNHLYVLLSVEMSLCNFLSLFTFWLPFLTNGWDKILSPLEDIETNVHTDRHNDFWHETQTFWMVDTHTSLTSSSLLRTSFLHY